MPIFSFNHDAMATRWQLFLSGDDQHALANAAKDSFHDLDLLERELSRFQPDSDITRLNQAKPGIPVRVGEATIDCLLLARDVHKATGGAFDITIGPLYHCFVGPDHSPRRPSKDELSEARACSGMEHLHIDPDSLQVTLDKEHMHLDLGGIGKGYALDQIAIRLREIHHIHNTLLNAGNSTILASGHADENKANGWPIHAGTSNSPLHLLNQACSGSGTAIQGAHIIDPRKAQPIDIRKRTHVWVSAPLASAADAFSTAFLILSRSEIRAVCSRHPDIQLLDTENASPSLHTKRS